MPSSSTGELPAASTNTIVFVHARAAALTTEMKGTILDPTLTSFKDYTLSNEMYSAGFILSFIFTGKESPHVAGAKLGSIVRRCTDLNVENRFTGVQEIIDAVNVLDKDSFLT